MDTAVISGKRKASYLVDGDSKEDIESAVNGDSKEDIESAVSYIADMLNERVGKLEADVAELRKMVNDMKFNSKALVEHEGQEEENDDDEESVEDASDNWNIMFRQLREHRMVHGDCKISAKQNPTLAHWIRNQRTSYKCVKTGTKGRTISQEKIFKLEKIGFHWGKNYPSPPSWEEMFEELKRFHKNMGHCDVPFNATNPNPLAKWAAYQRGEYKRFVKGRVSLLTLDQIGKLQEIGFNWKGPKM